jgi:hypothetical protein
MLSRLSGASTAKFANSAQSDGYNRGHASQMGHAAALKQQAARALMGLSTQRPPVTPGGPAGVPGGAVKAAPVARPAGFKQHIMAATGASLSHVHAAIDGLVGMGKLTPFQGTALKAHNGPVKPEVMGLIAGALPKPGAR